MYNPIPIKRSEQYYSNYWEGYSPKLKRDVDFFGDLNYEFWLLVETNPDIVNFCERPIIIEGVLNGKKLYSQFDMWLKWKDGRESFVKVIYSSKNTSSIRKLEETWCDSKNFEYIINTEKDIRKNSIELSNKKHLIRVIGRSSNPIETDRHIIKQLVTKEKRSISMIIEQIKNQVPLARIKEAIYWMIYEGSICSNVNERQLSLETEVWINVKT